MNKALTHLSEELNRVDELCVPSEAKAKDLTSLLKRLYDASSSVSSKALGPLRELHVQGLDADTIWEELQSKNRPLKRVIKNKSNRLLTKLVHEAAEESDSAEESEPSESGGESSQEGSDAGSDASVEEGGVAELTGEALSDAESGDGGESPLDSDGGDSDSEHEEMERWLDQFEEDEDKHRQRLESRDKRGKGHKGAGESVEEDDFDFVSKALYDLDEEGEEDAGIMASDFFGSGPKSATKIGSKSVAKNGSNKALGGVQRKPVGSDEEDDYYGSGSDGDEMEPGDGDDDDWDDNGQDDYEDSDAAEEAAAPLSKHQRRQAQIAATVAELEKDALAPKSWDMRGEVRGVDRPENSLLEVSVDVERASKPTPIVTQEYTNSLEDMILQRIKLGKFDDVIPREIRDKHADYDKEEFTLSQEKSKQGLGDIYADDFMQKTLLQNGSAGAREQETRDKTEIAGLFAKVCRQLDALSHFHYAPKPVVAETTITTSTPSIMMEDVGPTSESFISISMQAPEEVMSHKRGRDAAFLSAEELTRDDKKRLRRAAKMVRRRRIREDEVEEKLAAKVNPVLGRKYEAKKADKSMKRDRRVVDGSSMKLESDEKVKSFSKSANFFSALQKQSEEEILRKKEGTKKKKSNDGDEGDFKNSSKKSSAVKL